MRMHKELHEEIHDGHRLLAENVRDVIWIFDLNLNHTFVTPSVQRLRGYTVEEALKQTIDKILTPESYQKAKAILDREFKLELSGQRHGPEWSLTTELEMNRKDGSTVWTEVTMNILYDETGEPTGIIGVTRDITERKQTEKALTESRNYLDKIINSVADPIFVKDRKHHWVLLNDSLCNFMGHDRNELIGKSDYDFFPKSEVDIFWEKDEAVFNTGEENINEETFTDAMGVVHTIVTKKTLYTDNKGEMFIVGIIRDITERKEAEEIIRKSEERYRTMFEHTGNASVLFGDDTSLLLVNSNFEKLSGYSKKELEGKMSWTDFVDKEDLERMRRYHEMRGNEQGSILDSYEFRFINRNGEKKDILLNIALIPGTKERVGSLIDITERKQVEEERRKLEAQLTQAQKMESIGTLAGGIAHDFNNILSAIIGYTELAVDDITDPEKARNELKEVLKASDRAKDLVSQILTFSRKTETTSSLIALRTIVKESLKMLRSVIPTTVVIRQDLADSGLVLSNPTQIHQIIMNLSTNAADAMEEAGGVMEVSLKRVALDQNLADDLNVTPGTYLRLKVSDTGHGIPPEVMERIFEPYFTTKELGRGTGLGLSVVHGIVKSHGGAIICRSVPKKGTTFEVYLPKIESEKKASRPSEQEPFPTGTERILFVDDEPILVELAEKMLSKLGYTVVTQSTSSEALELFQKGPDKYDLVITDMTMPVMTGDKMAQRIMEIRSDIPIILCSGYSNHISEEKAKKIGIREFVIKPLEMNELAKAIRKALDGG
jgi:PAS domain S-box-containing protein